MLRRARVWATKVDVKRQYGDLAAEDVKLGEEG
jgi:hypothetical protein